MKRGGMGTNIIVFLVIFSFGLSAYYCTSSANALPGATCQMNLNYQSISSSISTNLFSFTMSNLLTIGGAVAIIGTLFFPNPYIIFLGVAAVVMGLVLPNGPIDTVLASVSGIPGMDLFTSIIKIIFITAIIAWYAGRDVW